MTDQTKSYVDDMVKAVGHKYNRSHDTRGRFSSGGGGGGGGGPLEGRGGNMGAGEIGKAIGKTKVGDFVEVRYSGSTPLRAGKVTWRNEAGTQMEVKHSIGKGSFKVGVNQNNISSIKSRKAKA